MMNIMSYIFVPFQLSSTLVAMSASMVVSISVSQTIEFAIDSMKKDKQMSCLKGVGILYSRIPVYLWSRLRAFGKYIIDLEWI